MPAHRGLEQIVTGGKDISHIVKDGEAETFSEIGQANLRKAQFLTVDEQCCTTNRKTGIGIAGSCLI